jgi:catechol 2,3-dioxygenase-like lactoylglutathione lyase family enzyme
VSAVALDHLILPVNDREASLAFYTETLGFAYAGERPPFTVVRVNESTTLQLAPWGTEGNQHLAFALPRAEFETIFARVRAAGIAYGDSFHTVGNMQGPGDEDGARGPGKTLYLPPPALIEIRYYV